MDTNWLANTGGIGVDVWIAGAGAIVAVGAKTTCDPWLGAGLVGCGLGGWEVRRAATAGEEMGWVAVFVGKNGLALAWPLARKVEGSGWRDGRGRVEVAGEGFG